MRNAFTSGAMLVLLFDLNGRSSAHPPLAGNTTAEQTPSTELAQVIAETIHAARYEVAASDPADVPDLLDGPPLWTAHDPERDTLYHFSMGGPHLRSGRGPAQPGTWGLSLISYGYADDAMPAEQVAPAAAGNRVIYDRGDIIEWYVNQPGGLKQGFTLSAPMGADSADSGPNAESDSQSRPPMIGRGWLQLSFRIHGDAIGELIEGGRAIEYCEQDEMTVRGYHDWLAEGFTDPEIWSRHVQQFNDIIRYCRERNVTLRVVFLPFLRTSGEQFDQPAVFAKVRSAFESAGVSEVPPYQGGIQGGSVPPSQGGIEGGSSSLPSQAGAEGRPISTGTVRERASSISRSEGGIQGHRQVDVIDLLPIIQAHSVADLVVNSCDAHPNEEAHKLIAEALWTRFEQPPMRDSHRDQTSEPRP